MAQRSLVLVAMWPCGESYDHSGVTAIRAEFVLCRLRSVLVCSDSSSGGLPQAFPGQRADVIVNNIPPIPAGTRSQTAPSWLRVQSNVLKSWLSWHEASWKVLAMHEQVAVHTDTCWMLN